MEIPTRLDAALGYFFLYAGQCNLKHSVVEAKSTHLALRSARIVRWSLSGSLKNSNSSAFMQLLEHSSLGSSERYIRNSTGPRKEPSTQYSMLDGKEPVDLHGERSI